MVAAGLGEKERTIVRGLASFLVTRRVFLGILTLGVVLILTTKHSSPPNQIQLWGQMSGRDCPRGWKDADGGKDQPTKWFPPKDRYLLSVCVTGRATNRFYCLLRSLIAGSLLNRTVIVPEGDLCPPSPGENKEAYRVDVAVDLKHLKSCLNHERGEWMPRVITLRDYLHMQKLGRVDVDTSIIGRPAKDWTKECRYPAKILAVAPRQNGTVNLSGASEEDFSKILMTTFESKVLSLGDLFYLRVNGVADEPGSWGSSCRSILQPPPQLLRVAESFIGEYTGQRFAAIHLRRTDFQEHCRRIQQRNPCSYWPLTSVAQCDSNRMRRLGLTILFVASDSPEAGLTFLRDLLLLRGITILRLSGMSFATASLEEAVVEKSLCARAEVFFYQEFSSFSDHINFMRKSMDKRHCWDGPVCSMPGDLQ